MSEVRAAAERLMDLPPWYGTQNSITIDGFDYEWLLKIRDAYLAEHRADDDGEVTEEWLRSVGFKRKQYQNEFALAMQFRCLTGDPQWIEQCEHAKGEFVLCRWSPMYDEDMPPDRVFVAAITRHQFRKLAEALAIPLTEAKAKGEVSE